ncbi:MAG: ELM1/GtrOC1 family putative glycosyltransferase [Chlamydiota bacterium]|nr:ELM1/GtrOC1 family putative glycosyltransferase [Chlamydiota bacterium]
MIVHILLISLEWLVNILPIKLALGLARVFGTLAYILDKRHRRIAFRNLCFAFPDKSHRELRLIAKSAFQNLALVSLEMLILSRKDLKKLYQDVDVIGNEHLVKAREEGKGVLFITGHTGNWEILACLGGVIDLLDSVIARKIKNPWVNRWVNRVRERYGVRVIEKGCVRDMIEEFRQGKIVGTLIDQDGGAKGCFVPFFGRKASTPTGLVRLGVRADVCILPIFVRRLPGSLRFQIRVCEELNSLPAEPDEETRVRAIITKFVELEESFIREAPGQWLWMHRRWKNRPIEEQESNQYRGLIMSDGKKGHLNQILGVLNPLGLDHEPMIEIAYKSGFHRLICYCTALLHIPSLRLLRWSLKSTCLNAFPVNPPDFVVSCGSVSAPAAYIMSRYYGACSILCMRSGFLGVHRYFDLVLLPAHDLRRSAFNIISLLTGTSSIHSGLIQHESEKLVSLFGLAGTGHMGVLIGGPTTKTLMPEDYLNKLHDVIEYIARQTSKIVIVVASRRTPKQAERIFLSKRNQSIHFISADEKRFQPVAALLGVCDLICVTEDSFSMVGEVIHAKKPLISISVPSKKGKDLKFEVTLRSMVEKRLLIRTNLYKLVNECRKFFLDPWTPSGDIVEEEKKIVTQRFKSALKKHR